MADVAGIYIEGTYNDIENADMGNAYVEQSAALRKGPRRCRKCKISSTLNSTCTKRDRKETLTNPP